MAAKERESNPNDHVLPPAFARQFRKGPTRVLVETFMIKM
jgi:hypothetical protein